MSFRVVPYRPVHLEILLAGDLQPAQRRIVSHVPADAARVLKLPGMALTALEGDHVIMTGGAIPLANRFGVLWAVLSEDAGRYMMRLHRGTQRFIEIGNWRRLEASVEQDFPAGCRWLELLGFTREGPLACYGDDGSDHWRYAKVQR